MIALVRDQTAKVRTSQVLADEVQANYNYEEIIGESGALREVLNQVELVASTDTSVLILGESGTGKELICRALHHQSPRSAEPLIKMNCAAIPSGLIESELFGHEKGAFTGAIAQKRGRFELAHEGTIFLVERRSSAGDPTQAAAVAAGSGVRAGRGHTHDRSQCAGRRRDAPQPGGNGS